MAGKTLIGGTAYTIKGGKTLIGGTAYSIKGGKTLIGGTAKTISFKPSISQLMASATRQTYVQRNNSKSGQIYINLSTYDNGAYYILSFCNGYMSINKVVKSGSTYTHTILSGNYASGTAGRMVMDGSNAYYSSNGTAKTSVYGGSMHLLTFTNFSEFQIDATLSSLTMTRVQGRNASSTAQIYGYGSPTGNYFANYNTDIGVSFPLSTPIFSTNTTNPSLLFYNTSNTYIGLSTNGTGWQSTRCGSIISFVEEV